MLTKKFKIVQQTDEPFWGCMHGHVLLGIDGEVWKVTHEHVDACDGWELSAVVAVPLRYVGPDEVQPDWQAVQAHDCVQVPADNPRAAVAKFWGETIAKRFVPEEEDECPF